MKKQIFITNGMGGVGKDTFAEFLGHHVNTCKISAIEPVKQVANHAGWSGAKTEKDRKFLSDLKVLLSEYADIPFKFIRRRVMAFNMLPEIEVLLIDIREPEEIARAVEEFGAKTILIKNDRVAPITSNMADANVFNYEYDFVIENNGTLEDFRETVRKFAEENILKEKTND